MQAKKSIKHKGVFTQCHACDKEIYLRPYRVLKLQLGRTPYCNKQCANRGLMTNEALRCLVCAKEFYCSKSQQSLRNRKTCSVKCRSALKAQEAEQRNKDNPPSTGVLNRRIRYSAKMDAWRKAVFERDDYSCRLCGARNGQGKAVYLQADHIKPFAYFPELRFELSNGRALCKPCHLKTDTYGRKVIKQYANSQATTS